MNVEYELVDTDGDPIDIELIVENVKITVQIKSLRVIGNTIVITLEYLHGDRK